MKSLTHPHPLLFGLFQKRLEGDDALWHFMQLRFRQLDLGIEVYASSPDELEVMLTRKPDPSTPVMAHLPRHSDLTNAVIRQSLAAFASRFGGQVQGWVVHDQPEAAQHFDDYMQSLRHLNSLLAEIKPAPQLFIEYACGLEPARFVDLFTQCKPLRHVSACVDVGHLGIFQARRAYALEHAGEDVFQKRTAGPITASVLEDVQSAVATALPVTLHVIQALSDLGKPLHFHLHDGHPLSRWSRFGVSDHLSFFQPVPIEGPTPGMHVPLMFGSEGLAYIAAAAMRGLNPDLVSFTLELHETDQRLPLVDTAGIFNHWRDKSNAERINHWLSAMAENRHWLWVSLQNAMRQTHKPNQSIAQDAPAPVQNPS
jgi:hypothetical protein